MAISCHVSSAMKTRNWASGADSVRISDVPLPDRTKNVRYVFPSPM